jgi:hypothetical protein
MTTLTEFLLARIAEDEAAAREAGADAMVGARWKSYPREAYEELQAETLHRARRIRATCAALRAVVELHDGAHDCTMYIDAGDNRDCPTLRALASIWADHPEFDPEWRLT